MNTNNTNLAQELPEKTHEKFLNDVTKAAPPQLTLGQKNIRWWPAEQISAFFDVGPCVGPLCVATRKTDGVIGSLFFDRELLIYYDFMPAEQDAANQQVENDG